MLMRSTIDPLDSQEARPYRDDPAIVAMTNMVKAYDKEDILGYEQNLRHHKELMDDPFVAENISDVTRNIRMKAITTYIVPYSEFTLDALCKELYIPRADLGELIVFMALNDGLRAQIDEGTGHVRIDRLGEPDRSAVKAWSAVTRENLDRLVDKSNLGFPMLQSHDLKKKKKKKKKKDMPGRGGGKKRGGGGKDDGGDDEGGGGKGGRKRAPNTSVAVPARFKAQGGAKGTAGRKGAGSAATSATPMKPSKPGRPPRSAMRINVCPATGGYSSDFIGSPTPSNSSGSSSPRQGGGVAVLASMRPPGALAEVQPTRAVRGTKCHGGPVGCQLRPRAPTSPLARFGVSKITGAADELADPPPYQLA
jgi:PCI domain